MIDGKYLYTAGVVVVHFFIGILTAHAQGPLTPPASPAPVMKSLDQIESRTAITNIPYTISVPGSYYLIASFTGIAATSGIVIATNDVTLDLNGYTLTGVPGSTKGIEVLFDLQNIAIKNGTVKKWEDSGIDATLSLNGLFENLIVSQNGNKGLVTGFNSLITRCVAYSNASFGISTLEGSTISDCSAFFNTYGIVAGNGFSTVSKSTANFNTTDGIYLGDGATLFECTANRNGSAGISCSRGCQITHCVAHHNTGHGIATIGNQCIIANNNCTENGGQGIYVNNTGCRIEANNVSANGGGIIVNQSSNLVIRNSATANNGSNYIVNAATPIGGIETVSDAFTNLNPWVNFSL